MKFAPRVTSRLASAPSSPHQIEARPCTHKSRFFCNRCHKPTCADCAEGSALRRRRHQPRRRRRRPPLAKSRPSISPPSPITALAADVALSVNPTISPVTVPGTAVAAPPLLTKVLENEKSIVTALVGEVAHVSTPTANRLLANKPATFMFIRFVTSYPPDDRRSFDEHGFFSRTLSMHFWTTDVNGL